jgi:hypothetical protein
MEKKMDIKLCSSKINLKTTSFADFVKKVTQPAVVKVASTQEVVKTAEKEKDEAETSGQPQAEAKLTNHPEKPKGGTSTGKAKTEPAEAETSGQPQAEAKLTNHPKVVAETKTEVKTEEKVEEKKAEVKTEEKKADVKVARFVKISKLDPKTRTFLRQYWLNLYPADYVESMLAEK